VHRQFRQTSEMSNALQRARTTRCGTRALCSALRIITSALSAALRAITSAVVVVVVIAVVVVVIGAVFEGEAIVHIPNEVVVLAKAPGRLGALPARQQAFGGAVALGARLTTNASCVVTSLPGGVVVFGVGIIVAVVREATIVLVVGGGGRRRRDVADDLAATRSSSCGWW